MPRLKQLEVVIFEQGLPLRLRPLDSGEGVQNKLNYCVLALLYGPHRHRFWSEIMANGRIFPLSHPCFVRAIFHVVFWVGLFWKSSRSFLVIKDWQARETRTQLHSHLLRDADRRSQSTHRSRHLGHVQAARESANNLNLQPFDLRGINLVFLDLSQRQ